MRRGQCRHLVGRKIGHGHRANTPSVSRADKEGHIVILLWSVIAIAIIQHTLTQRDVTTVIIGQAIGSDIICLGRLIQVNALVICVLIVRCIVVNYPKQVTTIVVTDGEGLITKWCLGREHLEPD